MSKTISTLATIAALVAASVASLPSEAVAQNVAASLALPQGERSFEASQTSSQIEREVRDSLRGEGDLRQIEVSVQGNTVTLAGRVQTFWAKDQAIKRTLRVEGVDRIGLRIFPRPPREIPPNISTLYNRRAK